MRSSLRPKCACFGLVLPLIALCAPVFAAGSRIDPDPRAPSLAELLQREEAAQARAAQASSTQAPSVEASAQGAPPVVPVAAAPVAPSPAAPARPVRQVYPSVFAQPAVTVLVPGHR